jgi:hypothetical protein
MIDPDLPPEFRHRNSHPEAIPLELPLDDEVPQPPVRKSDRVPEIEDHSSEPFLRQG